MVFSKTAGYRHQSIEAGIVALQKLGTAHQMKITATEDANFFQPTRLRQYDAIVFLNTTGDVLNAEQEAAFEQYIQRGGGFVGIHSASDTEYDWPWYGEMLGAYFLNHPPVQKAMLRVENPDHPATSTLPQGWKHNDEWYNFKSINPQINVLLSVDEQSYQGGENGSSHPVSWYHDFDGGRMFYTAMGHTEATYSDPLFLVHLLGGIHYAVGEEKELDERLTNINLDSSTICLAQTNSKRTHNKHHNHYCIQHKKGDQGASKGNQREDAFSMD
ncbi:MAG: ThuA domain-containing protein [Bacteroidota bacterium]